MRVFGSGSAQKPSFRGEGPLSRRLARSVRARSRMIKPPRLPTLTP